MGSFLSQVLYFVFVMVLTLGPAYIFYLLFRRSRRYKRSPICRDTLRGPGESLRKKIATLDEKLDNLINSLVIVPVLVAGATLMQVVVKGENLSLAHYLLILILYSIYLPIPFFKFTRRIRERANYQLGLDAELAVGRELNQVMREGFYVFHDFPEAHNNIDHVVVGPSGVFAVETKGRPKPDKGRGGADAKVIYTGNALSFPDNANETGYLHQARKQAASLSKWLSSAVGEPVKARPVLALPGWFVERKKIDDLVILYGKSENYARALSIKGPGVLSESMIKRIVHQLDAKCRDVEAVAYSGNKKKPS